MPSRTPISYDALESALQWSSSGAPFENDAYVSRTTGEVFFRSMDGDFGDEEIPEDIDDDTRYVAMPHKNDLDLGRSLVIEFVDREAPSHASKVGSFFRQRGAYGKFKILLEREGLLDRWHQYENAATREALQRWADENGFVVVG